MKRISLLLFATAALLVVAIAANKSNKDNAPANPKGESAINWLSWDEAVKANQTVKKKFFIDFYTDWCGWCKRMDKTTFTDPEVIQYINKNFHPVKFNAEQREDIVFQNRTFKWRAGGRNGVHSLAYELLNGRLGYPSYVYLTPEYERILISPGYKPAPDLLKELRFVSENHYENTTWDEFKKNN